MNFKEFESYLATLDEEAYSALVQERISRLNPEQQKIAQAREVQRKYHAKLIDKLKDPDPDVHQMVFDALRDEEMYECEHGRSYVKHCHACGEIDHLMFPEFFDKDGFHLGDSDGEEE